MGRIGEAASVMYNDSKRDLLYGETKRFLFNHPDKPVYQKNTAGVFVVEAGGKFHIISCIS